MIRPGRGDITTTRSERNTASGIECVTNTTAAPVSAQIRTSSDCIRSRVISSRAPNGSSISSSGGPRAEGPGDRDALLHPAGELARAVRGEVGEPDELEQLERLRAPLRLADAVQVERQLDVALHRAPLEQPGLLEGDAVVLVQARAARRLAVDQHACPRSAR